GGGEYGTYTWDSITGELNLSVINDSDGSGGLAGNNETATWNMKLVNGGLHLHSDQENEDVIFNPVRNERNSLVGSWYIGENNRTAHNILTILDDSNYVIAHSTNTETYGSNPVAVSSEWGSYSFNGDHFTVTDVDVDLDGPGGLYDSPVHDGDGPVDGPAILHPTGELTITDNADDENTFTFRRIGRYSVKLRDFEGDTQLVYVNAQESWDEDEDSIHFVFPDLIEPGSPNRYDLTFSSDQVITVDMGTENEERSGVMSFEGSGEDNVAGTWNINTAGTLVFTETDGTSGDYGHWRFLALNSSEILIHLDGVGSLELMFIATIPLSEKT
uniref:hypothetical protein n=1 Tax=Marinobacter sp. TaxID=50741 RepID=UPI00356B1400